VVLEIESGTPRGPCQALRGPEGSMHETVDGMLEEFEKAGISLPLLPRLYSLVTLTSPLTPTPTAPLTL
jgi:hypothetical protein